MNCIIVYIYISYYISGIFTALKGPLSEITEVVDLALSHGSFLSEANLLSFVSRRVLYRMISIDG